MKGLIELINTDIEVNLDNADQAEIINDLYDRRVNLLNFEEYIDLDIPVTNLTVFEVSKVEYENKYYFISSMHNSGTGMEFTEYAKKCYIYDDYHLADTMHEKLIQIYEDSKRSLESELLYLSRNAPYGLSLDHKGIRDLLSNIEFKVIDKIEKRNYIFDLVHLEMQPLTAMLNECELYLVRHYHNSGDCIDNLIGCYLFTSELYDEARFKLYELPELDAPYSIKARINDLLSK